MHYKNGFFLMLLVAAESRTLKLQLNLVRATNPFSVFKSLCTSSSSTCTEEEKKKIEQTQDLFLQDISKTMTTNLDDFTVVKEGEAEILMSKKNKVFFNKAQVIIKFVFFIPFLL